MSAPPESIAPPRPVGRRATLAGTAVLALLLVMVVALWLDPPSRHLASAPAFFARTDPLLGQVTSTGGFADRLGALLAQLDQRGWLGALSFAVCAALLSAATARLMGRAGSRVEPVAALPAALLLLLYSHYQAPVMRTACGMLVAVGLTLLRDLLPGRSRAARLVGFAALAVAAWKLAGPLPGALYLVLGTILVAIRERDWRTAVGCGLGLVPWTIVMLDTEFPTYRAIVQRWGGETPIVVTALLYASFPLLLGLGVWLGARRKAATVCEPPSSRRSRAGRAKPARFRAAPAWLVQLALAGAVAVLFVRASDGPRRRLFDLQGAAERQDWSRVLAIGRRIDPLPAAARLQIHRALFHLGRLHSELFAFPQHDGVEMLAALSDGVEVSLPLCDTFLELGHVNMAEHFIQEAMEVRGECPEILWRLALINVVKDRPGAARVFLNRLSRMPFHAAAARRWLTGLVGDPTLAGEDAVARVRALKVDTDWLERRFATEQLLRQGLKPGRPNRMAAEYLLAQLLLTRQTDEVLRNLDLLDATPSTALPRHVAEAVLAASRGKGAGSVSLKGRTIAPDLEQDFTRFAQAYTRAGERAATDPALAAEFGDTYWFYDVFGRSAARTAPGAR